MTTENARANWREYALSELENMEALRAGGAVDLRRAWTHAYQAKLTAFKYGDWNHPEVLTLLDVVYSEKKPAGGYGMNEAWDAYGDGTVNPYDTVYTVTMADHVGPHLLEGAIAGAVPEEEVYYVIDSIMSQPLISTGHGLSMSYSNQSYDEHQAVINVSAGAAAFLQKCLDAGFSRPGQQSLIDSLKPFVIWSYEKGVEERAVDSTGVTSSVILPGFWPYNYRVDTGQFGRDGRIQDWNHNAYTAESALTLGLACGIDSYQDMLIAPNYRSPKISRSAPYERVDTDPRAVQGRMRIQGVVPDYRPENMWQDADFWRYKTTEPKSLTDYAQGGVWAARLAETAHADSIVPKVANLIPNIKVYRNGEQVTGAVPSVPRGSRIGLRTDVRATDLTVDPLIKYHFIVNKPVQLFVNGTLVETKTTGIDGNIAFAYTINENKTFQFKVSGEAASNTRSVTVV